MELTLPVVLVQLEMRVVQQPARLHAMVHTFWVAPLAIKLVLKVVAAAAVVTTAAAAVLIKLLVVDL